MGDYYLPAIRIRGYRPFRDVLFRFNRLELIIGANGTGKTSLFAFLKFLRDACLTAIPPLPIPRAGNAIFHRPGMDRIFWNAQIQTHQKNPIFYQGELDYQDYQPRVLFERIFTKASSGENGGDGFTFLDFRDGKGLVRDPSDADFLRKEWNLSQGNRLGLGAMADANIPALFNIRSYILNWRFFSSQDLNYTKMRMPAPVFSGSELHESGDNLIAFLYHAQENHPDAFDDLKSLIRFAIPGFQGLQVKRIADSDHAYALWKEEGITQELTFWDLSEGILRFIAFTALCVMPSPPTMICIDNIEQGLHPRTLPILAGLFEKASEKTQVLLTTHDSYFLTQFDMENVSIMKKAEGGSVFVNIRNSQALLEEIKSNSSDELEQMYRADELEVMIK